MATSVGGWRSKKGGTSDVAGCKKRREKKKKNGGGSCRSDVKKAFRNRKGETLRVRGQGWRVVGKPGRGWGIDGVGTRGRQKERVETAVSTQRCAVGGCAASGKRHSGFELPRIPAVRSSLESSRGPNPDKTPAWNRTEKLTRRSRNLCNFRLSVSLSGATIGRSIRSLNSPRNWRRGPVAQKRELLDVRLIFEWRSNVVHEQNEWLFKLTFSSIESTIPRRWWEKDE